MGGSRWRRRNSCIWRKGLRPSWESGRWLWTPENWKGRCIGIVNGNDASYFVAGGLADVAGLSDRVVLVDDGESTTGYRVRGVDAVDGEVRIYTKRDGRGYNVGDGKRWAPPLSGYHPE